MLRELEGKAWQLPVGPAWVSVEREAWGSDCIMHWHRQQRKLQEFFFHPGGLFLLPRLQFAAPWFVLVQLFVDLCGKPHH